MLIVEVVGFAIVVLVVVVLILRLQARPIKDHPLNSPVPGIEVGSAAQITDAGSIGWPSLLDALSTERVDSDSDDGDPGPENSISEALGLKAPTAVSRFQPNLTYGTRRGRQVFIRIGIDESYLSGFSNRHMRQITVLRVDVPTFELVGEDGLLHADTDAPDALRPVAGASHRLSITAGRRRPRRNRREPPRSSSVRVQFKWLYDLWLVRADRRFPASATPSSQLGRSAYPVLVGAPDRVVPASSMRQTSPAPQWRCGGTTVRTWERCAGTGL